MGTDSAPLNPISNPEDFQDLERHELLTGEPRYIEDEIRNTKFAMIFGAAAGLFALIAMILCWFLYFRERTRTFLWHAIWLIFVTLFAFACAGWGAASGSQVALGKQPATAFTTVVFIGSLFFLGYLLVEAIWLCLYHRVHFDYLVGLKTDGGMWDKHMKSGSSFIDGWKSSFRLNWWTIFFSVAAAICFAFTAYASRSISWNRYVLTRLALYISLAFLVLSTWLTIYWVEEAYEYRQVMPGNFTGDFLELIKAFSIVALILAAINALVNFIQNKVGYFLFGILFIAVGFILMCLVGNFIRDVKKAQKEDIFQKDNCAATLSSIHSKNLNERWCSYGKSKYLDDSAVGCKDNLVINWEDSADKPSFLNPSCCNLSKYFYLYPFMLVGFWTLISIFCIGVAIACNFYLADTNDYLTSANKAIGPVDFAGLALVFLTLIGFGIYFWARKANKIDAPSNPSFAAYQDPERNKLDDFKQVPSSVKQSAPTEKLQTPDWCAAYKFTALGYPTFSEDKTKNTCVDKTKCVLRVALLFQDASFKADDIKAANGLKVGPATVAPVFFPQCTKKTNNIYFIYGSQESIQTNLKTLRACPNDKSKTAVDTLIYVDQVASADLKENGLLEAELPTAAAAVVPTDAETADCGKLFTAATLVTGVPTLKNKISVASVIFGYTMKGRFFQIKEGKYDYDIHNKVVASISAGGKSLSPKYTLLEKGLFTFNDIQRDQESSYLATIRVDDPTGVYMKKEVDVLIQKAVVATSEAGSTPADEELTAGLIRLLTKDGKVCAATDSACISAQTQQVGQVTVATKDGSSEDASAEKSPDLAGATVTLARQHFIDGSASETATTDSRGVSAFVKKPYDAYTVVATKAGFNPSLARVDLQEADNKQALLVLRPTADKWDMRVTAQINEPAVDFDLILAVKSDQGKECQVSPYNKFCAYAAHVSDVKFSTGTESIVVKKLAVANYAAYLQPAPTYDQKCDSGSQMQENKGKFHYEEKWDWSTFKVLKPLFALDIVTETYTSGQAFVSGTETGAVIAKSQQQLIQLATQLLPTPRIVESDNEAKRDKQVLNVNGEVAPPSTFINTYFRKENASDMNPPEFAGINGTITEKGKEPVPTEKEGGCEIKKYIKKYTNDTTVSKNVFVNTTESHVCENGTSLTKIVSTNTSTFYDGKTGVINYESTQLTDKKRTAFWRKVTGKVTNNDAGKTEFSTLKVEETFETPLDSPATSGTVENIDIKEDESGPDSYKKTYTLVHKLTLDNSKTGTGSRVITLIISGTKADPTVNNVTDCTITVTNGERSEVCNVKNKVTLVKDKRVDTETYTNTTENKVTHTSVKGAGSTTQVPNTDNTVADKIERTVDAEVKTVKSQQKGVKVDKNFVTVTTTKPTKSVTIETNNVQKTASNDTTTDPKTLYTFSLILKEVKNKDVDISKITAADEKRKATESTKTRQENTYYTAPEGFTAADTLVYVKEDNKVTETATTNKECFVKDVVLSATSLITTNKGELKNGVITDALITANKTDVCTDTVATNVRVTQIDEKKASTKFKEPQEVKTFDETTTLRTEKVTNYKEFEHTYTKKITPPTSIASEKLEEDTTNYHNSTSDITTYNRYLRIVKKAKGEETFATDKVVDLGVYNYTLIENYTDSTKKSNSFFKTAELHKSSDKTDTAAAKKKYFFDLKTQKATTENDGETVQGILLEYEITGEVAFEDRTTTDVLLANRTSIKSYKRTKPAQAKYLDTKLVNKSKIVDERIKDKKKTTIYTDINNVTKTDNDGKVTRNDAAKIDTLTQDTTVTPAKTKRFFENAVRTTQPDGLDNNQYDTYEVKENDGAIRITTYNLFKKETKTTGDYQETVNKDVLTVSKVSDTVNRKVHAIKRINREYKIATKTLTVVEVTTTLTYEPETAAEPVKGTYSKVTTPTVDGQLKPATTVSAWPAEETKDNYPVAEVPASADTYTGFPGATRRRILMEKKSLKPVHRQGGFRPEGGDYILISCFNGFGPASLVELNEIKGAKPTVDECAKRVSGRFPEYTLENLVKKVAAVAN